MRKHDRSQFKAGLFIVVTFFLIAGIILGIKGFRSVFTPVVERKVRFALTDDIGGLRLGDDVRLGGFKIGVIHNIQVQADQDRAGSILITYTVPREYPLHQDAHMAVQGTLTGSSWLNIDDLGHGPMLSDADELIGHPSAFGELFATLGKTGPELQSLVTDVRTTTVPRVNTTLKRASEMAAQIRDLFGDTKTDFRGTVSNLNSITASAKAKLPDLLTHADDAIVKIGQTIDNTKTTLQDLQSTMANAKDLTASARSIVVDNRGKFDGMIASLKTTGDNLKGASAEIRRSPWRLLYKPAPGEVDNMTLFDAARQFSDGANSMSDAAVALRDAVHDPKVDPEQLKKLIEKLDKSFESFTDVEQKLWQAVKE